MREVVIARGQLSPETQESSWVLIFGGVTRQGNRRARRAARASIEKGYSVVWFDGFGETYDNDPRQRVPLDTPLSTEGVTVIDYSVEERGHWLNRIVNSVPSAEVTPLESAGSHVGSRSTPAPVLRRVRRLVADVLRWFQKRFLRRVSQIFRGVIGWNLVKRDVATLAARRSPPVQIVFGDDFAQTQAWHAVRIWPQVEAGMLLENK